MLHEPALKQDSEPLPGTHEHARHAHSHSTTQAAHPNIAHCHSADLAVPSGDLDLEPTGRLLRGKAKTKQTHSKFLSVCSLAASRREIRTTVSSGPAGRWERQVSLRLALVRRPPTVPAAPQGVDSSLRGDGGGTESYNVQYAT